MKTLRHLLFALLASLSLTAPARAAFDYYLHFDGIPGEVTVRHYEDWISIGSYAFGAAASGGTSGGGSGSHDVAFSDLSFTKLLDTASPLILEHLVLGKVIPTAQLDIVTAGPEPRKAFSYSFEDVLFTSVSHSGGAPGQPVEADSFNFGLVTLTTFTQDPKGGVKEVTSFTYDLRTAAPVPEPSSWALLAVGLVTVGFAMARTRNRSRH